MVGPPQRSTLFPYTTLFRSRPWRARASTADGGEWGCRSRRQTIEPTPSPRSEEYTSELQSRRDLVCRLLLEKKKNKHKTAVPSSDHFMLRRAYFTTFSSRRR